MRSLSTDGESPLPFARFTAPTTTDSETRLVVCSDMHVTPTDHGSTKVYHRTAERFRRALTDAESLGVDAVVCTGDLTKDGERTEFECVDEILEHSPVPFFAVPGNHDVPKTFNEQESPPIERFETRYTPGQLPYHTRVGEIDLIGLDSASGPGDDLEDGHGGYVTEDQLAWLEETLAEATTPVVVLHHPIAPVSTHLELFEHRDHYRLHNAEALLEVLTAGGVSLVLSGHIHWPFCWRAGDLRQVVAPATSSFPQAALLLRISPSGTEITVQPLADGNGLEEAYRHARAGCARGQAIVESTESGYFDAFPVVDETAERPRPVQLSARSIGR